VQQVGKQTVLAENAQQYLRMTTNPHATTILRNGVVV
jgi:hypothetical protein